MKVIKTFSFNTKSVNRFHVTSIKSIGAFDRICGTKRKNRNYRQRQNPVSFVRERLRSR